VIAITAAQVGWRHHRATVPGAPRQHQIWRFPMRTLLLATIAAVIVATASIMVLKPSTDDAMEPFTLADIQDAVYGS
jgi:hypothetical protein